MSSDKPLSTANLKKSIEEIDSEDSEATEETEKPRIPTIEELPDLIKHIKSNDSKIILQSTRQIRHMVSIENNPPLQQVIESDIVPTFVQFLKNYDKPILQFESAWIISNICSGDRAQCEYIVKLNVIPIFHELIKVSKDKNILTQSIWAIGNIAGESNVYRDLILKEDSFIQNVLKMIKSFPNTFEMYQHTCWALANLCRGKPKPPYSKVKCTIPFFCGCVKSENEALIIDACWGLSYLADGICENIYDIKDKNLLSTLVGFLPKKKSNQPINEQILTPSLRILGTIATGDYEETQLVLETGILEKLEPLLRHQKQHIKRETLWLISNFTAGKPDQIQKVIDSGIITTVVEIMNKYTQSIRKECCWVISNGIFEGTDEQIAYFAKQGCIVELIKMLEGNFNGGKIIYICLETIQRMIDITISQVEKIEADENPYISIIKNVGGVEIFERYKDFDQSNIRQKAKEILKIFDTDTTKDIDKK
ncbi:importin alpha [Anaeramoeba flamelloides]|uniref:Importin subunit alpha n=1 Tax=Anaeramoeba flamelloides TaxID=1746091 RepID=A0AAV8AD33_9EUKA|nr:importin alpha [Anaeramoeba flamelloides]